jgi:hypothetical protein
MKNCGNNPKATDIVAARTIGITMVIGASLIFSLLQPE